MMTRKHPTVEMTRYVLWLLMAATTHNPYALLFGLAAVWFVNRGNLWRQWAADIAVIGAAVLVNMLTNHRGETYLFYINDNIVTKESLVYGAVLGMQIALLIHITARMSRRLTADKLIIVTGHLSPAVSILLSMAIRNVNRYHRKLMEIYHVWKSASRSEGFWTRFILSIRSVSILISWALENGLETADSMTARGYGSRRRTSYIPVRHMPSDVIECLLLVAVMALWEWGQPDTILSPYIQIGFRGWWLALTAGCMLYEIVEEWNEDRYQTQNNIRKTDSARHCLGDR